MKFWADFPLAILTRLKSTHSLKLADMPSLRIEIDCIDLPSVLVRLTKPSACSLSTLRRTVRVHALHRSLSSNSLHNPHIPVTSTRIAV